MPLLRCQRLLLLHQNVGGAHDAGQRRADVVGHRPQQIGVNALPLRLTLQDLYLLGAAGQHTGDHRNEHHDHERQRKARQRKADLPVRRGKHIVHAQHAGDGDKDAEQIPVRQQRRQKHIQKEDHRHIAGISVGIHRPQQQTQHHRDEKQRRRNDEILSRIQQRAVKYLFLFRPLSRPRDLPFFHALPSSAPNAVIILYCITDSC